MTQIVANSTQQEPAPDQGARHSEGTAQAHSGEGVASLMAQLLRQGEKFQPQDDESADHPG